MFSTNFPPPPPNSLSFDAAASIHAHAAQLAAATPHARLRRRAPAAAAEWVAAGATEGALFSAATRARVPPALFLRRLLECPPFDVPRTSVTDALRSPSSLAGRLAGAVPPAVAAAAASAAAAVVAADTLTSPRADAVRHVAGLEAEALLCAKLAAAGIPFWHEDGLRAGGFAATPDARIAVPASLPCGAIVHWIDSKAAFGTATLHAGRVAGQYARYVSRYGSGLVIYWAGHDASLASPSAATASGVAVADRLPELRGVGGLALPGRACGDAAARCT